MDGLYTGAAARQVYVNSEYKEDDFGDAVLADPDKTHIEAFRDGLKLVREAAGPDVFFLGCCAAQNMRTYGGAFGLVDAMRIGPDNSRSWAGWPAARTSARRNYFLNGRVWYNDPDPSYVRASLSADEARTIASWASLRASSTPTATGFPAFPPNGWTCSSGRSCPTAVPPGPVDFFDDDTPAAWLVTDDEGGGKGTVRRDVLALFNWDDRDAQVSVPASRLGLPDAPAYAAFDFWAKTPLPPVTDGVFKATLPKHGCLVLAVRPMLDRPFLLSTSRHVSQGMVDVKAETWDPQNKTLSGESAVVAGDPYELRIVAPAAAHLALNNLVISSDTTGGVPGAQGTAAQSGEDVRVTLTSPASRRVGWTVTFH